jgi:hypothetical protein
VALGVMETAFVPTVIAALHMSTSGT